MSRKIQILIVEDEGIQAMALEDTLQRNGYEIVGIADHATEALEMVQENAVDLVILDVNIKGNCDGIDTALRIQELRKIPFIYLTAYMDIATQERAEATNPVAYINKPYQEARLLAAVDKALEYIAELTLNGKKMYL